MTRADRRSKRTPIRMGAAGTSLGLALLLVAGCGEAGSPGAEQAGDTAATDTAATTDTMPTGTAAANEVQVSLTDFSIDMPGTLPAGPTVFHVNNDGAVEHNFEVEGQGIEQELEQNLAPGGSATLRVDLEPGTYEIYCPVADHADRGMRMELRVEQRTGGGA